MAGVIEGIRDLMSDPKVPDEVDIVFLERDEECPFVEFSGGQGSWCRRARRVRSNQ